MFETATNLYRIKNYAVEINLTDRQSLLLPSPMNKGGKREWYPRNLRNRPSRARTPKKRCYTRWMSSLKYSKGYALSIPRDIP